MNIEIVNIGDELLLGFTIDTNGAHLARELAAMGVSVVRRTTVGDEASQIVDGVRAALDRTGAVITTGGLGPTSDDLTKPSIAALFGREMRLDEEILANLERRWSSRFNAPLPVSNRQQAMIPEGATIIRNNHGSAPGIWLEDERGRWVAMLPGVPREMRGMLADTLVPMLRERQSTAGGTGTVVRSATLRTTGIGESTIADRLGDLARGLPNAPLAYLPNWAGTDLRLTVRASDSESADETLAEGITALRGIVGDYAYAENDTDLAEVVLSALRAQGLRIAVGESCTGGLLAARLTSIPGSSDAMLGGVIAYDNAVKREQLGVPAALIEQHGAVSEPVAVAMATGVRDRFHAGVGVGITGIAGPGGGTPEKPVGTVWIAIDMDGAVRTHRSVFIGDREEIRQRATQMALELIRRGLNGASPKSSAPGRG